MSIYNHYKITNRIHTNRLYRILTGRTNMNITRELRIKSSRIG